MIREKSIILDHQQHDNYKYKSNEEVFYNIIDVANNVAISQKVTLKYQSLVNSYVLLGIIQVDKELQSSPILLDKTDIQLIKKVFL